MGRAEAARRRWEAMTPDERRTRVQKLQAGRRKARSPEALAEIEAKIEALGEEFKSLPRGDERRIKIMREIRPLGQKRLSLKYADCE